MNKLTDLSTSPRLILAIILGAYLFAASLFALLTPPWQMPDEPAHYNYIAHIAHGEGLPVLKMGDFDMDYIGQIVGNRFPPDLPVDVMRYEFYQPPLFYVSAVPVYLLAGGMKDATDSANYGHALTGLRFYGIGLGLVSLLLLYGCLAVAFPTKPAIRLGATAFAGTLPMHVAMTASVNNDTLAILLLLASSFALLTWMKQSHIKQHVGASNPSPSQGEARWGGLLGVLFGLGLLTKIYAYVFLPVCLLMIFLMVLARRDKLDVRAGIIHAAWVLLPALLIGLPLWLRNMSHYGLLDPLGLTWHDLVVAGQPTTTEWIAQFGWPAYWERAFGFTFRSFWGVFGWLGVFWDGRIYTAMQVLSITIFLGLAGLLIGRIRVGLGRSKLPKGDDEKNAGDEQFGWIFLFLGMTLAAILLSYVLYNLKFVQHQGRYFFWGMLPLSTFFALGWRQLQRPGLAFVAALILLLLGGYAMVAGDQNPWTLMTYLVMIAILLLRGLLHWIPQSTYNEESSQEQTVWGKPIPQPIQALASHPILTGMAALLRPLIWAFPYLVLFCLAVNSLFGYIIPQLAP